MLFMPDFSMLQYDDVFVVDSYTDCIIGRTHRRATIKLLPDLLKKADPKGRQAVADALEDIGKKLGAGSF